MNPNMTDKGLGTSPDKDSSISPATMENQQQSKQKASQAAAPTLATSLEDANDAIGQTSPKAVTSTTILTEIEPQVATTKPSSEQEAISSSESSEYEDDLPLPTFSYRPNETSLTQNIRPQTWSPQAMGKKEVEFSTTSFGQKGLSKSPEVQRKGDPKTAASAKGVNTEILPGINPIVKATVPDTISKFQFTLSTPIPQQPVQSAAVKPFLFTRKAKQPLKEAQFGPVKRRVLKPSKMDEDDDDALKYPPMIFNLPESFDFKPRDKKPAEDSKFLPVKSSLAEAFTIAPQATMKPFEEQKAVSVKAPEKSVQEPRSIPVNTTVPDTDKFPLTQNAPIPQDVKTKILPGLDTIAKATASEITGKFPLSSNTAAPQGVDSNILPGIIPIAKATVPDATEVPFTLNPPTPQSVNMSVLPSKNPIANATAPETTTKVPFKLKPSNCQSVKRRLFPEMNKIAEDTKILPEIDPVVKATVPDSPGKFQLTLNTPVPQQPVQPSAAEPFLFTREAKQSLKEAQFGPVKRRVDKPSRMKDDDDDEPKFPPMIFDLPESFDFMPLDKKPVDDSKFLPVKSSLAEAFTTAPQTATKPAEEQKVVPIKANSARPPTHTNAPKKPIQEPQPIPVKSPVAKKSVLTQQARQPTALPEFPATKLSVETESTQPMAQSAGRQEGKLDDDKKSQMIRELLVEKTELRSQRNALAMEKAALEAKLQEQAKEEEGRKALSARNEQQARELERLRARLVKETEAKEKATSRANRLQKTINEQVDALREAGVKKAKLQTMVDNKKAELAKNQRQQTGLQAEADIGLANAVMEGERARGEEEDKRREGRVLGSLENLRDEGRRSRQRLMDELESKDAELHEAKREVRELGQKLLASSQANAEALVAASASKLSPSSPSPPQISIPIPSSSSISSTVTPWFQLNLSPRRLLILLFIFLLAFLIPLFHFNSLSQPASEERGWSTEVGGPRHQRIIQEARILEIWEQQDPVTTAEEGWRRTREAARGYDEGF